MQFINFLLILNRINISCQPFPKKTLKTFFIHPLVGVTVLRQSRQLVSYQYPSRGGLSWNELSRPVLGLRHEGPFELLLALSGGLLLLLFRIIGTILHFFATAEKGKQPPHQHDEEAGQEGEDARKKEAPVFPFIKTCVRCGGAGDGRLGRRLFARHPALGGIHSRQTLSPRCW